MIGKCVDAFEKCHKLYTIKELRGDDKTLYALDVTIQQVIKNYHNKI